MDESLTQLADLHGGVFTTAQAYAIGHGRKSLLALQTEKAIVSLGRSAYAVAGAVPDDPVERHTVSVRAALLMYPDAAPCGASLLAYKGVAGWGLPLDRVDLVRPVDKEVLTQMCRLRPPHPLLRPVDTEGPEPVAKALALTAIDHGFAPAVVSADDALRRDLTTAASLGSVVEALDRWPYASRAHTMLALTDGRSESVGESRLRMLLRFADIDVVPQVRIEDPPGSGLLVARVDFLVEGTNIIVEFDGKVKYAAGDPEVVWKEKRREDRLRRLGYVVIRVVWSDLEQPAQLLARIRAEIARTSPDKRSLPAGNVVG